MLYWLKSLYQRWRGDGTASIAQAREVGVCGHVWERDKTLTTTDRVEFRCWKCKGGRLVFSASGELLEGRPPDDLEYVALLGEFARNAVKQLRGEPTYPWVYP